MDRRAAPGAILGAMSIFLFAGCGAPETEQGTQATFALQFAAKAGDQPFACTSTLEGLGTSKTSAQPLDFRMYVHDVRLIRSDGSEVPLSLEQDGQWQRDDIAFLDFEDGTGTCKTGSPQTRTEVIGNAPAGEYVGVAFVLGLPKEMNHLDAATAPAPLNIPGMWWSWQGGYKFVRLELATPVNPTYFFHLGATSCEGTVHDGFSCAFANLPDIRIEGFDPGSSKIVFDIAALYAGSDLDLPFDPMTNDVAGCMAFAGDSECPPVFDALGLSFEGQGSGGVEQTTFRVE